MFSFSLYEPGLQLKFNEVFGLKLQTEFQVVTTTEGPALLGFWDMKKNCVKLNSCKWDCSKDLGMELWFLFHLALVLLLSSCHQRAIK